MRLLKLAGDKNLSVKCDNYKANIIGFDKNEYPIIPKIENNNYLELKKSLLKESISSVINSSSISESRIELNGVFFNFEKNILKIAATDSFRLSEKTLISNIKNNGEKNKKFIVPLKTTQELIRILDRDDNNDLIKIYVTKNQVLLKDKNKEIISRLIEGEYPNYEQIIPKNYETTVIVKKQELINAIKSASFFSSKINDVRFKIDKSKQQIEIISQNPEFGNNNIVVLSKIDGKNTEIVFNYKYIIDGLNNIKGNDVIIWLNGDSNPCLIKSPDNNDYIYIIMPIKLS